MGIGTLGGPQLLMDPRDRLKWSWTHCSKEIECSSKKLGIHVCSEESQNQEWLAL